jgi:3-oxoacyl-[acyl-carrier-protein] synthase-1
VTAVGTTAAQTFTSIRAGIRRVSERPFGGSGGDPGDEGGVYLASSAEGLVAALGAAEPLDLSLEAAREALFDAGLFEPGDVDAAYGKGALAVFLALPYPDTPGADPGAAATFLDAATALGLVGEGRAGLAALPNGHAAGLLALQAAAARLLAGEIDVALVGGQDSMLNPARVSDLERRSKLRTDRAPGGAIPGEGSAFVVLERLDGAKKRSAAIYAAVESTVVGHEPVPFDGQEPSRGEGATKAVSEVLASAASSGRIADVFTDLNGERGRSLEWGLVETRCLNALPAGWRHHVPAAMVGDLGAASGVLLLAFAAWTIGRARGGAGSALVCCAAERGERVAVVLATPQAAAGR